MKCFAIPSLAAALLLATTVFPTLSWDAFDDDPAAFTAPTNRPNSLDEPSLQEPRRGARPDPGQGQGEGLKWTDPLRLMMEAGGAFPNPAASGQANQLQPGPADMAAQVSGLINSGPQIAALRLEVSGSPMPGATIEIRGYIMADLYPLDRIEYTFSLPPGFSCTGESAGRLDSLSVWDWREVRLSARVPEVPEAGEIYLIVDAPIDRAKLKEWARARRDEGEKIDSAIEDRLENLEDTIRLATYLNPWWSRWECYPDTPPYHGLVISGPSGPGPAMVLDDPGALESARSGMLAEEESDLEKRLGMAMGEDRFKEKAIARDLAAVRYRLIVAGVARVLKDSPDGSFARPDNDPAAWPQTASRASRAIDKIVKGMQPPVTVPDRALRLMMVITSASLVLEGTGKVTTRSARAVDILEGCVAELAKPIYEGRPEAWLKRYASYNLGMALKMAGRASDAAVRFQDAFVSGPGFLAPMEAIETLPGRGRKKLGGGAR